MTEDIQINRDAIVEMHRIQNLAAMDALVASGELSQAQADQVHKAYMASSVLQTLVTRDAQAVEAMMKGQVH